MLLQGTRFLPGPFYFILLLSITLIIPPQITSISELWWSPQDGFPEVVLFNDGQTSLASRSFPEVLRAFLRERYSYLHSPGELTPGVYLVFRLTLTNGDGILFNKKH